MHHLSEMGIDPESSPLDLEFLSCTFLSFVTALFSQNCLKDTMMRTGLPACCYWDGGKWRIYAKVSAILKSFTEDRFLKALFQSYAKACQRRRQLRDMFNDPSEPRQKQGGARSLYSKSSWEDVWKSHEMLGEWLWWGVCGLWLPAHHQIRMRTSNIIETIWSDLSRCKFVDLPV